MTLMYRRMSFLPILACLASSCSQKKAALPNLGGRWIAELEVTYRNDYPRNSMHLQVPPRSRATLALNLASDSLGCTHACSFTGNLEATPDSFLAPEPPDWTVTATFTEPDSVFLSIGPCCDAGALYLDGHFKNGKVQGRWLQNFLGPGDAGRFTLVRPHNSP
jgi:hypothetical protein